MATYVNDLRLKEIATGDEAGTWGASTNTNLELIGEALGYGSQNCFAGDVNTTTTVADGASDPARAMYFKVTSTATLTGTRTLTIGPNTISRVMLIENATTGGQSLTISQGSGANVTIANGAVKMVYLDGAGAGAAVVDALADLELGTITVSDLTATGTTTLAGASTTADITFGDNDKAVFGAGSDLQIYSDGTQSIIQENGPGALYIQGTHLNLNNAAGTSSYLTAIDGGAVTLFSGGSAKLATTSTGIDVTGTVTADGLTVDTNTLYVDAANNRVGIGTTSPTRQLHVKDPSSYGYARIEGASGGYGGILEFVSSTIGSGTDAAGVVDFYMSGANHIGRITVVRQAAAANNGDMLFYTANAGSLTEKARINNNGHLLVGKTTDSDAGVGVRVRADGLLQPTRDGADPLSVNRLTSTGAIVVFRKDGTAIGEIGASATSTLPYFAGSSGILVAPGGTFPCNGTGVPTDDTYDLGGASYRWDDVYASNGTIQTSDANEKQDVAELDEAERRVAVACKGLLRKFRWKSSVAEKGDDARIHFGIIAQDLKAAFEAEGLDAGRYAMFVHSTWTDEETGEERSRMGVRYSELLAFIIAAL